MDKIDQVLKLISEKTDLIQEDMDNNLNLEDDDGEIDLTANAAKLEILGELYNEIKLIKNSDEKHS